MKSQEEIMELYEQYEHLIFQTINRNYMKPKFLDMHSITVDDLTQFGRLGLYKACEEYDETKNPSLRNFAITNIKWAIQVETKRNTLGCDQKYLLNLIDRTSLDREITYSVGIDDEPSTLYDFVEVFEEGYSESEVEMLWSKIKKIIPENTASYIELRMSGYNNIEIAKMYGVSRQAVERAIERVEDKVAAIMQEQLA
ncbi:sigma-70 family RNA polymerase sigma factor [Sporosarcina sp. FSL W7-1283]|uniref:sigma-70 family RNA polymerase sigma factor n=1 Tax=Sporosarcina sp. FSL W7-1283 TaxID=2921560 RepID=UPI0030FB1040